MDDLLLLWGRWGGGVWEGVVAGLQGTATEKKKRKKRGWHFHHGRQLARVFLIKRGGLHEWVTVISAEEDTYT